jgi:hypothetical protein
MYFEETRVQKVLRVLHHIARVDIKDFPNGPGATQGRALKDSKDIIAPLTGRSCLAYTLTFHRFLGPNWAMIRHEQFCTSFLLESEKDSVARVDGTSADLALVHGRSVSLNHGDLYFNEHLKTLFSARGLPTKAHST